MSNNINKITFEDINIKPIEVSLQEIDNKFVNLKLSRDKEFINELEYCIYEFSSLVSDNYRIYTRNWYKLEKERDKRFIDIRKDYNSDLSTIKYINTEMREDITYLELQKMMIDWLEDKRKIIIRLADNINSQRIGDLADAKRNQI